jgi:hypothetical protein
MKAASTFEVVAHRAHEVEQEVPTACDLRVTASASLLGKLIDEFEANGGAVFPVRSGQYLFGHLLIRLDDKLPHDCFKIVVMPA